jgi:ABC-type lipoprotein release transport system permease subunit
MLNNQELVAENLSDLEIKEGDQLKLMLESRNPITLKIVSLQRRLNIEQVLQFVLDFQEEPPINLDLQKLQALVKDSGLFYERKLLDFFIGKVDLKSILEDTKAQLLSNILDLAG